MLQASSPQVWTSHFAQVGINPEVPGGPPPEEEAPREIFNIPKYKLNWLDQKIEALNKAAAKLKLEPVGYNVLREYTKDDPQDETGMRKLEFVEIKLFGESPILKTPSGKAYQFVSRIMHAEGGNLLKNIPGVELPLEYRTVEPKCQHCNYKRNRKDTYVLRDNDTQEFLQVGSTCIKDFLGHPSAGMYASWAESLADMAIELEQFGEDDYWGEGGGRGETGYEIERFLQMVYAFSKAGGWKGRAKAREDGTIATVDIALNMYHSKDPKDKQAYAETINKLTADDKEMLSAALEWARGLKDSTEENIEQLSDYFWNLAVACSSPVVKSSTTGIVASLPIAYNKEVLSKIQPDPTTTAGNKGDLYVGRGVLEEEHMYGSETSYRFRAEDGKLLQWSSETPVPQPVGSTMNIEGTVVGYGKMFFTVTTRLARVKVLDDNEYEAKKSQMGEPEELGEQPVYQVGQKVTTDVAILDVREIESHYTNGYITLYTMIDRWNNTLKWFSSSNLNFEKGERLNITANVKKLDEYQGKPQIVLNYVKVNSREIPEDEDDPRLTQDEEKAVKKERGRLKRQLTKLQKSVGIKDDQDLYQQQSQVINSTIENLLRFIRGNVDRSTRNPIIDNYGMLIDNYQSVGQLVHSIWPSILPKLQQSLSEQQAKITPEHSNEWNIKSVQRNIDSFNSFTPNLDSIIAEFVSLAEELHPRKQQYEELKPQMDQLTSQINEINNRLYEHSNAVKHYGPKAMLVANWLTRNLIKI